MLWVDLDCCFLAAPDALVANWGGRFGASRERWARAYPGLNTHLVLLRPNPDVFDLLMSAARHALYVPYTNTEQDLLEAS